MKTIAILFLSFALCSPVLCQGDKSEKTAAKEHGVWAPAPIYFPDPQPRGKHKSGTVVVEAVINAEGKVTQAKIKQGLDEISDQAALKAVTRWRFKPAMREKKPVAVLMNIQLYIAPD